MLTGVSRAILLRGLLCLSSSALTVCSFALPGWAFLAWFSLVPLLFALEGAPVAVRVVLGFLYGLGVTAALSDGLVHSLYFHLGLSEVLAWGAIALPYAGLLALFFGLFAGLLGWVEARVSNAQAPAVCAALWVCVEWLRGHAFIGFPFGLHGHSQFEALWLIQVADLGGVYVVSFVLVLVNRWLVLLFRQRRSSAVLKPSSALVAFVLFATLVYGQIRLFQFAQSARGAVLTVSVVDADVSQGAEEEPDTRVELLWRKLDATKAALSKGAKLVVWPETSHYSSIEERVPWRIEYALGDRADLVLGAVRGDASRTDDLRTNTAYLVQRGFVTALYDKRKLFPFGEYDPTQGIPFISGKLTPLSQLLSGDRPGVLPSRVGKLGVLICFEALYPELSADAVLAGAELLVVMANDAWFGPTLTNRLTPAMLTFRAVEMRRDLLRAANRGASGSVSATGASRLRFLSGREHFSVERVQISREISAYARWGDVFCLLCALLVVILARREHS